ncbi:MAG: TIGR01548 family HAD-type hydrolase [Myxococcales bacterium]|nr:MAG: TIGR01548 family HAD-type hydrolase [Myxococcales bacterium]
MSGRPNARAWLAPRASALTAYQVPRHGAPIDLYLDGNEGLTPPPGLLAALGEASVDVVRRYPSARALEARLAARHGVEPERVLVAAGGDDAIDRLCRAVLAEGRTLVLPVPTFEMIARYGRLAGADVIEVPWGDGPYPARAVAAQTDARTGLVVLVSPNNPTGRVATVDDLHAVAAAGALVLVDLAYVEFGDEALWRAALDLPNTVVIRTLSKAHGLAGLRVGYAVGPVEVIEAMRASGAPYAVSGPSLWLAGRWLDQGADAVARFVGEVKQERAGLATTLRALGADVPDSEANFVFARLPSPAAALWTRDALAGLGVAVRAWPGRAGLDDALRVTVPGDADQHARLVAGLSAALRPQALLFDLDGVLADVSGSYRRCIVETAASYGVAVSGDDIVAIKHAGNANNDWVVTHRLLAARGMDVPYDEVRARFEALYHGDPARPGLHETESLIEAHAALAALATHYPLAIVTGRPRRDADRFLARFDLARLFTAVITMDDAPLKPDPAPVRLALARLGVTDAWMIGDTPDDVRAARAAGVVPLGVTAPLARLGVADAWMIGDTSDDVRAARAAGVVPLGVTAPGEPYASAEPALTAAGAARVLTTWTGLLALLDLLPGAHGGPARWPARTP